MYLNIWYMYISWGGFTWQVEDAFIATYVMHSLKTHITLFLLPHYIHYLSLHALTRFLCLCLSLSAFSSAPLFLSLPFCMQCKCWLLSSLPANGFLCHTSPSLLLSFFPGFCLIISELHFNLLFSLVGWLFGFEFSVQTQLCFHVFIIWALFISFKVDSFCEFMAVDDITSFACGWFVSLY